MPAPARLVKASHAAVALLVAVVGFLGAMQVIGTEAQGDDALMRELSEKVLIAEASAGVSGLSVTPRFTSAIESSKAAPLESREGLFVAPSPEPTEAAEPLQGKAISEPTPEGAAAALASPPAEENPACAPDPGGAPFCNYVVQEGDTLSDIADGLGIESTPAFSGAELIALSNGLNDAQNWLIQIGQELRVPVDSGVIHTVSESETVSVLAELYGVTMADVITANGLADVHSVVVGATLLIPSPNLWPLSSPGSEPLTEDAAVEDEDAGETETEASPESTEAPAGEGEGQSPTAEDAAEETATPEAAPPTPSAFANPSVADIRDQFAAGYIAAGGPPQYIEKILATVIPCESGYNLRAYNPAGPFYGLMQFLAETWARTGGGDWFDAWQQGHNTGVLLQGSNPASQWPSCWR